MTAPASRDSAARLAEWELRGTINMSNETPDRRKELHAFVDAALAEARADERRRIREAIDVWGPAELVNPDSSGTVMAYFVDDVDAALSGPADPTEEPDGR